MEIEDRIKNVMSNVFDVVAESITDATSLDTIEKWNSLGQMSLVIALEEEFGIRFSDIQVIEMISYPLVVHIVKENLETK